jgi:hypothetical protein
MPIDLPVLRAFEDTVRKQVPTFKLGYKDQSFVQKAIGFLFPFNPSYMTSFITTFYPTVYFPSQAYYEGSPAESVLVLAHEFVHLMDTKAHPIWFRLSYALPQILALVGFVAFGVLAHANVWILGVLLGSYILACLVAKKSMALFYVLALGGVLGASVLAVLLTHWVSAALFAGLACVGPWPSPGRTEWELRGYSMNLAIIQWINGSVSPQYRETIKSFFTGPSYFFMSWNGKDIASKIDTAVSQAQYGQIQVSGSPYEVVYDFLNSNGLIRK